jgi:hypothetical protein
MLTISELARGIGFSRQYVQRCVKEGCPLTDFESARLWFGAHRQHPKKELKSTTQALAEQFAHKYSDDPKIIAELAELFKTLINSAIAAEEAFLNLEEAFVERKTSKISTWLNLHSKAVEARVKAERMVREELERRKILIPISEAQMSGRKVVDIIVSRLSALPQNLAHAVNPSNPDHAFEILQRECMTILSDAQKALA